ECEEQVEAATTRLTEALASARHTAQGWATDRVREALSALTALGPPLERCAARVAAAKERAAGSSEEALGAAPGAQRAAAEAGALQARVDVLAEAVAEAVAEARSETVALEEAQRTVRQCATQVVSAADTLRQ